MGREFSEGITATMDDLEIRDGTELYREHGIPEEWGTLEGDGLQVPQPDGALVTFVAVGPEEPGVFAWGVDEVPYRTHRARLTAISRNVLRVTVL